MTPRPLASRILAPALAALALATTAWAAPVEKSAEPPKETVFSLAMKGGPVMVPLGICSVISLAMSIERFISLRKSKICPAGFMDSLLKSLNEDPSGMTAQAICIKTGGPLGKVFWHAVEVMDAGKEAVEKAMVETGARAVDMMKLSLRGMRHIIVVAPLLGLLGTITGLITAFQMATISGMGKADVLAKGIYEALVTTVAGLVIAIPVLMVHDYLDARIDGFSNQFEEFGVRFLNTRFPLKKSE
jgi:biopolymer transport protein ExbB